MESEWVTALSPASVGNVAVGFDLLGHSVAGVGDRARVRRTAQPGVRITAISGATRPLPLEPQANTAGVALLNLLARSGAAHGFELELHKGIPYGSGMGGSAASAVAALWAGNALLDAPLPREQLYPSALAGEALASGSAHGDNVGPMLLGGLVLATADALRRLPVPDGVCCLLVHPHAELETRRAREVLQEPYPLSAFVAQSERLARLLDACYRNDVAGLRGALEDVLVEPRRAPLVQGFAAAKAAALATGALGASLSGAGPSVFAWYANESEAAAAKPQVIAAFAAAGIGADAWISPVDGPRVELVS